jgi:hypothetical protein
VVQAGIHRVYVDCNPERNSEYVPMLTEAQDWVVLKMAAGSAR